MYCHLYVFRLIYLFHEYCLNNIFGFTWTCLMFHPEWEFVNLSWNYSSFHINDWNNCNDDSVSKFWFIRWQEFIVLGKTEINYFFS